MTAKINKEALATISARAMYSSLKAEVTNGSMYAGISYIPDSDWSDYTAGTSGDTFSGGSDSEAADANDILLYNSTMYTMHKVFSGGISRIVSRKDWVYGDVYESYPAITGTYVLVKEFISGYSRINVYRCLFSPRTASVISPTGVSQSPIYLSDGYVWKYMYTITNAMALRFLTDEWMPVPEKLTDDELSTTTSESINYDQYLAQINAIPDRVFPIIIDSDALVQHIEDDSDFKSVFNWGSIQITANEDTASGVTTAQVGTLSWNTAYKRFEVSLTETGEGYLGGNIYYTWSGSTTPIAGISTETSPGEGFGSDPAGELDAQHVMITARSVPNEDNELIYSDRTYYNLLSLHTNPIGFSSGKVAKSEYYITCNAFETSDTNSFVTGETIYSSSNRDKKAVVVTTNNNVVYYVMLNTKYASDYFTVGDSIENENASKLHYTKSHSDREIKFNRSSLIIANKLTEIVTRVAGQVELFNFIIEF